MRRFRDIMVIVLLLGSIVYAGSGKFRPIQGQKRVLVALPAAAHADSVTTGTGTIFTKDTQGFTRLKGTVTIQGGSAVVSGLDDSAQIWVDIISAGGVYRIDSTVATSIPLTLTVFSDDDSLMGGQVRISWLIYDTTGDTAVGNAEYPIQWDLRAY